MCLGQVVEIVVLDGEGTAIVADGAALRRVLLITLDGPAEPGDWLVVHSGFALARITPDDAADALAIRATAPSNDRLPPKEPT